MVRAISPGKISGTLTKGVGIKEDIISRRPGMMAKLVTVTKGRLGDRNYDEL